MSLVMCMHCGQCAAWPRYSILRQHSSPQSPPLSPSTTFTCSSAQHKPAGQCICVIVYLCICVIVFVYFRPGASVSKLANICRDVYLARCSWTPHSLTIYTLEKTLFFARFQLYQPTIGNIFLMHRNLKNYKVFQPWRTAGWIPRHNANLDRFQCVLGN